MSDKIKISALCITYGRPHLLEEAIESFLKQDYDNKELIIVNDLPEQTLVFEHPQVKLYNFKERFKTIGEKRNKSVELSSGDILTSWDDDDLYLPWMLSSFVKMFESKPTRELVKPNRAWTLHNGEFNIDGGWCAYAAFTRKVFNSVGGYKQINSGQDMELLNDIKRKFGSLVESVDISKEESAYIFRWGGTGSYHLSGFGKDKENLPTGLEKVEKYVKCNTTQPVVELKPHWNQDYTNVTRELLKACSL